MNTRWPYLTLAFLIFLLEIAIAKGLAGGGAWGIFVRGYLGDALVIVLLYFLLRGLSAPPIAAAWIATLTGFVIEALQYWQLASKLGFHKGQVMYTLIGNTFSAMDLLMYVIGGAFAIWFDRGLLLGGKAR